MFKEVSLRFLKTNFAREKANPKYNHRMASHLNFVNIFVRACFLFQLFFVLASPCLGEDLEPRQWAHLPVDTNLILS